jgi:hypothetical protein
VNKKAQIDILTLEAIGLGFKYMIDLGASCLWNLDVILYHKDTGGLPIG